MCYKLATLAVCYWKSGVSRKRLAGFCTAKHKFQVLTTSDEDKVNCRDPPTDLSPTVFHFACLHLALLLASLAVESVDFGERRPWI